MAALKHYINGRWESGVTIGTRQNPSDLSDTVAEYARADAAQAESAIRAAADARDVWAASTPQRRFEALDAIGSEILARKDELGQLLSREEGKTLPEGIAETARAGQIFKFFAAEALRIPGEKLASVRPGVEVEVTREPVGVVGLIAPWNFPLASPHGRSPRRWPMATRWCSSPPSWCRRVPRRWPRSSAVPGCPRARSTC